jgi:predicted N-acetyltransferase YhbS
LLDPATGAWVSAKVPGDPPAWEAMDPKTGWIGAVAGSADEVPGLLDAAEEALHRAGMEAVVFGGDPRHIYSGVPEEETWLAEALSRREYERGGNVYDLYAPIEQIPGGAAGPGAGPAGPEDVPALLAFLEREFQGRWLADTRHRLAVEADPSFCIIVREGAEVVAFAHASHLGRRFLQPALNFHLGMGKNPGGVGPVGVARAHRGRGLGRLVMRAAIEALRSAGVDGISVDWTGLLDFYGKFGLRPWAIYASYRKRLAE